MFGTQKTLVALAAGLVFGLTAVLASAPVQAGEKVMVVLDGSGSMWGRIDEEPKISIAQRVLKDVLGGIEADVDLGLMSYGHREEGNCADIEIIIEPGPGNGPAIGEASDKINPLGKTPLSDAVRMAAESLSYTDERASVILITDGIETCDADPCALGMALEEAGIDFTAHVIGFGLSAEEGQQVACLAENTGGLYLPAGDADQLEQVLGETVEDIAEAEPEVIEEAPEAVEEEPEALPEASVAGPESVEIGRTFTGTWEGPGERRDALVLWDPTANQGEGREVAGRRLINGDMDNQAVDLVAPVHVGTYELRYVWGSRRIVLATTTIEVVDAPVSLDAPATVAIGKRFTTTWEGPGGRRDTIEIIDPTGDGGEGSRVRGKRLVNDDFENNQVTMEAPAEPGFYRLQYWNGDNREVLATREIEVLDAPVSLTAEDTVPMGRVFDVTWEGPGARRDAVEIFDQSANQGEGKVISSQRLVNGDFDNASVRLTAPAEPGDYLLRYWNGDNRTVLATRPISVAEVAVSLSADDAVPMGRPFDVTWQGPGARRDAVEIFDESADAGRGKVVSAMRIANGDYDNAMVTLNAPAEPGEYLLRYWNGDSRTVLATRPITVEAVAVSLDAAETVKIGQSLTVTWEGPGARRDAIELFDPEADAGRGKVLVSQRITNGDYDNRTVELTVPVAPKTYELRYWNGDGRTVLATRPVTVEPMDVSLDGPASVGVEETFAVTWEGPGAYRDAVEVFDPRAAGGQGRTATSTRLVNGDYDNKSVNVRAPKEPGNYLLRYWNGDFGAVLFEAPIIVE
ncbi:vWA domain-containing protein [Cucumibacter marinus]|uniref:vWA domain-containing protein n=1 Tax=Cucumibacter marinus TaxID=1121252 RepID=UPI0003FCA20C|nr:VWA domain-containing protein [Cucumibacter marinus]